MTEDMLVKLLLAACTIALGIAGYFMRRTIERLESENTSIHQEMREMKDNYIERFEEIKDIQAAGMAQIMKELAAGGIIFAEIKKDVQQIKAACTYIPRTPHT